MCDTEEISCGVWRHMAWNDNGWLTGADLLKIGDPGRALLLGGRIGDPDMDSSEDQHSSEHGAKGRHPEITAVGQSVCIDDLNRLAIDLERFTFEGLRDHHFGERLRPVLLEL